MHCSMPEKLKSMIYKRVLKLIKKNNTTHCDAKRCGGPRVLLDVSGENSRKFCRNKIAEGMTVTLPALDLFDS